MSDILWQPSPERIRNTRMEAFRRFINNRHRLAHWIDYPALHQWSIDQRPDFWQAIVAYFDVQFPQPARRGTDRRPRDAQRPVVSRRHPEFRRTPAAPARRSIRPWSRSAKTASANTSPTRELAEHVAGLQNSLRSAGVGIGDRVAACMPNTWQTLVGMLATTSLGAIWSCSSPDFGTQGVIDRFGQIEPKVLITCAGYRYAGRTHRPERQAQ